jgi:hypothetical protein
MDEGRPRLKRKRQQIRRRRHQSAWVTIEGEAADRECWVEDISQAGAKMTGVMAAEVGSQFAITLVPRAPKRRCEVVWRQGNTRGIRFLE